MKKMMKSKLILLTILLVAVLSISIKSYADDNTITITPPNATANNETTTGNSTNTSTNNTANPIGNVTAANTTPNNVNNTSSYNNTNLPKTGAEDYTAVYLIAGVCLVSAVYAYKKVKEYKGLK